MGKDFYTTLGISKTANDNEIKEAYEKLSSEYQPDKDDEKDVEDKFKEISEAYNVLSDKDRRQNYDRSGGDGLKGQGDKLTNGRCPSGSQDKADPIKTSNTAPPIHPNRPKLFVRPAVKSNHVIIQNALMKVLEGAVNAELLKKMQTSLNANLESCEHILILFRNRLQFRGLYKYDEKQDVICKLDGIGPKSLTNEDIFKYYKFDSPKREFIEVQTKHISLTIIAFTIHDHLWPKRPSHLTQSDSSNVVLTGSSTATTTTKKSTKETKPVSSNALLTATK